MSLANENRRLREIVQQLLDRIDENQQAQHHFHSFELKLLNADGLHQLLTLIMDEACAHFRLASVSLLLLDESGQLEDLLETARVGNFHNRLQLRSHADFYQKLYPADPRVILQEVDVLTATRLFPGTPKVGSAAFLPLMHQHRVIGSLHFASSEVGRYSPEKATDLLEHFAAVTSSALRFAAELERQEVKRELDPELLIGTEEFLHRALAQELNRARDNNGHLACVTLVAAPCDLKPLAATISACVRKVDACARWAQERIVILLPEADSRQAHATAERIRKAIEQAEVKPSYSLGINAWKARKSKAGISEEKLREAGESLLNGAYQQALQQGRPE
jgi:uncharacterized protein YigA (DUF484 family)